MMMHRDIRFILITLEIHAELMKPLSISDVCLYLMLIHLRGL